MLKNENINRFMQNINTCKFLNLIVGAVSIGNRYIDSDIPMLLQVFVAIKFNRSVLRYYELARGL